MLDDLAPHVRPLISRAETLFGPAAGNWPHPDLVVHPAGPLIDCTSVPDRVYIVLDLCEESTINQGLYQLAHEVVHWLMLSGRHPTTMIEEGACVWFSLYAPQFPSSRYLGGNLATLATKTSAINYFDALNLYSRLTAYRVDAIRHIRHRVPFLIDCKPDDILACIPEVPAELAEHLCVINEMR